MEDADDRRRWARVVRAALAELPRAQRAVVELAYFEGRSHPQIAEALSMSVPQVAGLAAVALHELSVLLELPPA